MKSSQASNLRSLKQTKCNNKAKTRANNSLSPKNYGIGIVKKHNQQKPASNNKTTKPMMGSNNSKATNSPSTSASSKKQRKSSTSTSFSGSNSSPDRSPPNKIIRGKNKSKTNDDKINNNSIEDKPTKIIRKSKKQSSDSRPRRRASQTYFFKYQLAVNPSKAEEEDLRLALLASLEQCPDGLDKITRSDNAQNNKSINVKSKSQLDASESLKSTILSSSTSDKRTKVAQKYPSQSNNDAKKTSKTRTTTNNSKVNGISNASSEKSIMSSVQQTALDTDPKNDSFRSDDDSADKYKPDTEDFLTFICFRASVAGQDDANNVISRGHATTTTTTSSTATTTATAINTISSIIETGLANQIGDKKIKLDNTNCTKSNKSPANNKWLNSPLNNNNHNDCNNNNHNSNISHDLLLDKRTSPIDANRPTRKSQRLASTIKKISGNINTDTANDNMSINYEEDMKRASKALEVMAQEINSSDVMTTKDSAGKIANTMSDSISTKLPSRNNKHIVKGLMTREFAGAFADEEAIFGSISKHKL